VVNRAPEAPALRAKVPQKPNHFISILGSGLSKAGRRRRMIYKTQFKRSIPQLFLGLILPEIPTGECPFWP